MPRLRNPRSANDRPPTQAGLAVIGAVCTVALLTTLAVCCSQLLTLPGSGNDAAQNPQAIPIPCHSHNDFWRREPLMSAVQSGCIGVEADVWPFQGQLLIGHGRDALSPSRTFSRLYVEPLTRELEVKNRHPFPTKKRGLFGFDPTQTLILLIDVKRDPERAWPLLLDALEPLRERNFLSFIRNGHMSSRPVTILVSGKMPPYLMESDEHVPEHIVLDAPISKLPGSQYYSNNSYWASGSFTKRVGFMWLGKLWPHQIRRIRQHVQMAHDRGLGARYWGLPAWPLALRDHIRSTLLQEGVDIINVDGFEGISEVFLDVE